LQKLIGQRVRDYRNAKGYSIEELAHIADMNAVHLASLERGEKNITLSTLEKVSKALGVPLADVFSIEKAVTASEYPIVDKAAVLMQTMTEEEQHFIIQTIQFIRKNKQR
jgi:transcriptional regulator with XRE-family HTH domain